MKIFVGGSLGKTPAEQREEAEGFLKALVRESLDRGHKLLTGCMGGVDVLVAQAAQDFAPSENGDRLTSYWLKQEGSAPAHRLGRVVVSEMEHWGLEQSGLKAPEQIASADVAILVAGTAGTHTAANWARIAGKPLLGVARYSGAAEAAYHVEMARFDACYSHLISPLEFQKLGTASGDVASLAKDVVDVAESMLPRKVFPIMSFKTKYKPIFAVWDRICRENGYQCMRTDHDPTTESITPRILKGIEGAPFVLADITEPSPNVFFEVGYGRALGRSVILTAQAGTERPFDVKDLPVIFWNKDKLKKFRKRLDAVIKQVAVR